MWNTKLVDLSHKCSSCREELFFVPGCFVVQRVAPCSCMKHCERPSAAHSPPFFCSTPPRDREGEKWLCDSLPWQAVRKPCCHAEAREPTRAMSLWQCHCKNTSYCWCSYSSCGTSGHSCHPCYCEGRGGEGLCLTSTTGTVLVKDSLSSSLPGVDGCCQVPLAACRGGRVESMPSPLEGGYRLCLQLHLSLTVLVHWQGCWDHRAFLKDPFPPCIWGLPLCSCCFPLMPLFSPKIGFGGAN